MRNAKTSPLARGMLVRPFDGKDYSDARQNTLTKLKKNKRFSPRKTNKTNSAGESGSSAASDDNDFDDRVKESQSPTNGFKITNKFFKNVVDVEKTSQLKLKPPTQLDLLNPTIMQKDSGISSCYSSQELSPDLAPVKSFSSTSSQETFCSEYEEIEASKNHGLIRATNSFESASTITSHCSTLSQISSTSGVRSLSSCSGPSSFDKNVDDVSARRSYLDTDDQPDSQASKKEINVSDTYGSCMMCLTEPKNGVFVHSRFLHMCCCYRCAVKVWNKRKRCPICNCKVNNVLKLFVH